MKSSSIIYFVLIATFSGLSSLAIAQDRYTIGSFVSFPQGEFKETGSDGGGYALNGKGIIFENRTRAEVWPEYFYVGFHLKYASFQIDNTTLVNDLNQEFAGGVDFNVFTGYYRPVLVTLGPHFLKKMGQRFSAELKTGFGIMFTNIDPILIEVLDDQGTALASERLIFSGSPNFSYKVGVSLNYDISDYAALSIFADQSYTKESISSQTVSSGSMDEDFQKISFINTGFMLSFRFL